MIESADYISSLGYNEVEEVDSIIDKAESDFRFGKFYQKSFIHIKDTLTEAWDRFENMHKSKEAFGVC